MDLSRDAILACMIVVGALVAMATTTAPAELILAGAMVTLMALGVIAPDQAVQGFANTGVLTIAALYIVVAGLRETGAIAWLSHRAFRRPRSLLAAQARLMAVSSTVSTIVNNTPVVAMFIPVAQEWSTRYGFSVSKLLLPLNHMAVIAGTCTLIGTSTNLVVNGLLEKHLGRSPLGLFDIAWVGVPITIAGFLYVLFLGRKLLPDRKGPVEQLENAREYAFEARILPSGGLAGKSIAEVGLRSMKNAYVLEIVRGEKLLTAVGPSEILQAEDRLIFVGVVDAVKEMRRIPGITIAEEQTFKLNLKHSQRTLVELVLSGRSPLVGLTVREARFRSLYDAAIISISRDGTRLPGKLGDIRLRPGDTMLVEAASDFAERHRYDRDFLLVSQLQDSTPPNFQRAPLAVGVLALMMTLATTGVTSLLEAAFISAGLMIMLGCVTPTVARNSIEYGIITAIAASFSLGVALTETGAADQIARGISAAAGTDPYLALIALYIVTVVVTEMVTNAACAVVMFPIAISLSEQCNASLFPFVIAVMIAASAGFITPIGYQTHLMVYGPGGYKFSDFARFGAPMTVITAIVALYIIPRVWPF
jgi:di/tricarboxylate transporter